MIIHTRLSNDVKIFKKDDIVGILDSEYVRVESFMIIPTKEHKKNYKELFGDYVRIIIYKSNKGKEISGIYSFPSHKLKKIYDSTLKRTKLYIDDFNGEKKIENPFVVKTIHGIGRARIKTNLGSCGLRIEFMPCK